MNCIKVAGFVEFTSDNAMFTRNKLDITKLRIPKTNSTLYQRTYFNRIVFLWNTLPGNIRNALEFATFKKGAYEHFLNLVNNYFDCNETCTWSIKCRCQKCLIK